jgi:hypothetical protein
MAVTATRRPPRAAVLRRTVLAAALTGACCLSGCTERDRSNPLDPSNLEDGGALYGFNALAGDGQVELRWNRLTQVGVLGYRLTRWRPGESPSYVGDLYPPHLAGTVDTDAVNGEEYVYRLFAYLETGDSVASPTDTAQADARRVVALSSTLPGIVGLTPDGRDVLYAVQSDDAYEDIEADDERGVLWLSHSLLNRVDRLTWTGAFAGPSIQIDSSPSDVSVNPRTGSGWVAFPHRGEVISYRSILTSQSGSILDVPGTPRVVEIGAADETVWVGTEAGRVFRYDLNVTGTPPDTEHRLLGEWAVGGQVGAIALDETRNRAFVLTRSAIEGGRDSLRIIDAVDSTVSTTAYGLVETADLAFDPVARQLWISERGAPRQGLGRLSRASEEGEILQSWSPLEPFGIDLDAAGTCWIADLRSRRVLAIWSSGVIRLWSAVIDAPYQVRVGDSGP